MSIPDSFEESENKEDNKKSHKTNDNSFYDIHAGATCSEVNEMEKLKFENKNMDTNDVDNYDDVPLPPPSSPTLPTLYHDLFKPSSSYSRRFSCMPSQFNNSTYFHQRSRAPSLPIIADVPNNRNNNELSFKKLLYDNNSRRSSIESAYHSHASDRSTRTSVTNAQIEDIEYSQEYSDNFFNYNSQSMLEEMSINEDLERSMIERRNSLSYEAIRDYFLEFNPYNTINETEESCLDHSNNPSSSLFCPHCYQRRTSIDQTNIYFRTNAHRQVVERQFEELFNIPDPRRSRSTSIDIFGGLGIPFPIVEHVDSSKNTIDEEDQNLQNEKIEES